MKSMNFESIYSMLTWRYKIYLKKLYYLKIYYISIFKIHYINKIVCFIKKITIFVIFL